MLQFKNQFEKLAYYFFDDAKADEFTLKLADHILESSLLANDKRKVASSVAQNVGDGDKNNARKKSIWKKIFLPTEQMKFLFPILKKAIFLLPFCHVIRWLKVLFTRPKAIAQLKNMQTVNSEDLSYMVEIRNELGINHL